MATESCSKCLSSLDTDGYPKWCKSCRAKYRREYEVTRDEMMRAAAFQDGVRATREYLIGEIARRGTAQMLLSALDIARWISEFPAPRFAETTPSESKAQAADNGGSPKEPLSL